MISIKRTALAASILMGASLANAATINFVDLAGTSYGQTGWAPLALSIGDVNMTVTAGSSGADNSTQFAYLDTGNVGLGSCTDLRPGVTPGSAKAPKRTACSRAKNGSVNAGQYLEFVFDKNVTVDNLWFNNGAKGDFKGGALVSIDGVDFSLVKGHAGGGNGIGGFNIAAGDKLVVAFENKGFNISGIEVSEVPLPGTLGLLGAGLAALGSLRRKVMS